MIAVYKGREDTYFAIMILSLTSGADICKVQSKILASWRPKLDDVGIHSQCRMKQYS